MEKNNFIKLLFSIIVCEMAGIIGSIFTVPSIKLWYATLNKPAFNPPNWIFGPVWTTLFLLMGISFYIVWSKKFAVRQSAKVLKIKAWNRWSQKLWTGSWQKINVISIFILQLVLNICWSLIFFGMHLPGIAFFELLMLWFAILYTIINFHRISKLASYLLLPYLLWVTFAALLNLSISLLNP
ncbi:MAG: tryptophan-rich sensory protein [Candidatus Staskawiczbacteria bacterium]|nr:tryptophan-rich sensory protein [Candidatus Staskawiczbacteria bacterium]